MKPLISVIGIGWRTNKTNMPFTLSHPAAILPVAAQPKLLQLLPLSALIIGSITPDLAYFLPFLPGSRTSHSFTGIFIFSIPTGLVFLWLFHALLKRPLLSLIPESHQRRLVPLCNDFRFLPLPQFGGITIAVVLGAFTHIAWDSFTHAGGWFVVNLPLLDQVAFIIGTHPFHLYSLLQHGSTLVGGFALFVAYWRWYQSVPAGKQIADPNISANKRWGLWLVIGLTTILAALLSGFVGGFPLEIFSAMRIFAMRAAVGGLFILGFELFIYSCVWQLVHLRSAIRA